MILMETNIWPVHLFYLQLKFLRYSFERQSKSDSQGVSTYGYIKKCTQVLSNMYLYFNYTHLRAAQHKYSPLLKSSTGASRVYVLFSRTP